MSSCSRAAKIYISWLLVMVQRTSNNGFLASSASYMSCLERLWYKSHDLVENKEEISVKLVSVDFVSVKWFQYLLEVLKPNSEVESVCFILKGEEYICMIYKIYTFQYEANQFLYGLGKGHQQYNVSFSLQPIDTVYRGSK